MSSQRRFEGPVLEDLLEQVRAESGGDARIVAANRVRRGGLGGFFAKEHFEVVVDESPREREAEPTRGRSRTEAAARPTRPKRREPLAATSVLDLVDATNDEEREHNLVDLARVEHLDGDDTTSVAPRLSTQTEGFQAILERLADGLDGRGPERGIPNGRARRRADDVHDVDDARDRRPRREPRPDIEVLDDGADVLVISEHDEPAEAIIVAEPFDAPPRIVAQPFAGPFDAPPTIVDEPVVTPAPVAAPVPAPPRLRRSAPQTQVLERPENALARLGVPPKFVPRGMQGARLRAALLESLSRLPAPDPVPDAQGVVIAIVGVGSRPVMLARALAEEHGYDPDNVVVASSTELRDVPSWLQMNDADTADERRRSWRRREHATFVAVSLTGLGISSDWAHGVLDRLEPTQVWAITTAATKPEDIEAWAERLGGVDVLALERLDDTTSPAAVMRLPVPVGRLDGAPATALRWTELLLARIGS